MRLGACALLAGMSVASRASAQEVPPSLHPIVVPPDPDSRRGIHAGAGIAVGLGGAGTDAIGPWLEGAFSLHVGLSSVLYLRIEPGIAWFSSGPTSGQDNLRPTPVNGLAQYAFSNEYVWQVAFLVRATMGIDLGRWLTVRAGPLFGASTTHLSSELCSASLQSFVAGATVAPEVRFGPRRQIEVGPQVDLVWMARPYCIYQKDTVRGGPDFSLPPIPVETLKPTFNILLHAAVHFG